MNKWIKLTAIKVVKTMAETAIGVIGAQHLLAEVDWKVLASGVALSGIVTILFALKNIPEDGVFHDDHAADIRDDIEPKEEEGVKHE